MPKKQLWYLPVCGAVAAKEGYQTGLNMGLIMLCYQGFRLQVWKSGGEFCPGDCNNILYFRLSGGWGTSWKD